MSLTSRIQALTTYINELTGQNDTNLSDAVATLAEGYGQGGGYTVDEIASNQEPSGAIVVNGNVATKSFENKQRITSIHVKGQISTNAFPSLTGLVTVVAAKLVGSATYTFSGCSNLRAVDIGMSTTGQITGSRVFTGCTSLQAIILRQTTFCGTATAPYISSPIAAGGTGVTIYVPSALKATYEADSVWSGLAVTFASIEGSIYETQYADGTPIE